MIPKGWDVKPLGELVTIRSGGTPSKSRPDYWGGSVNWFTAKDLKSLTLRESELKLSELGAQSSIVVEPGTILVLTRGMGLLNDVPMGICEQRSAFNQDVKALFAHAGVHARFLLYALANTKHRISNLITTAGHGTCRLETESLLEHSLLIPEPSEQAAIAGVLSIYDAVEERVEALLTAKRRSRQALAQRLLAGKARLPGFTRDWQPAELGALFKERREAGREDLPLLAITGDRGIVNREELAKRDTSCEDKRRYLRIAPGDIGYNTMRMWQGVCALSKLEGIVSPAYTICTPRRGVSAEFMVKLFQLPATIHLFHRHSQGLVDDTLNLKFKHFAKIKLAVPTEVKEQQAIAAILNDADREIALHRAELDALKRQKRGLMQQLLTGKVRVP
ncbi:MAG: restriction endonuclease subunit S [Humidesulfovibrio sp.]|uniref:restriction endonuclease subunit S n=1 Tax=Humidesulfovibrio sp. TaxID=2910988 RepID=UPI002732DDBA|nr:restriction endonuclease subunit S [Humidesulfovibrio sp.]MDP2846807.1 restriction endonuclease subunit S [Humidesulfovibrio sp.]